MKLLLDENLSDRIIHRIVDLYPESEHVKTLELINTDDAVIWEYAKANGFVIVSKDSDFHQRSLLYGHPPKFVYLRIGNSPTSKIVQILRDNFNTIAQFADKESESILVLAWCETESSLPAIPASYPINVTMVKPRPMQIVAKALTTDSRCITPAPKGDFSSHCLSTNGG